MEERAKLAEVVWLQFLRHEGVAHRGEVELSPERGQRFQDQFLHPGPSSLGELLVRKQHPVGFAVSADDTKMMIGGVTLLHGLSR